ncbi:hypothetical protein O9929_22495 [Vibrio lentus]|nr:hypothetical protein [Vibrio lentus]
MGGLLWEGGGGLLHMALSSCHLFVGMVCGSAMPWDNGRAPINI